MSNASAADAEAASAVWQAVQTESGTSEETSGSDDKLQTAETPSDNSDIEAGVRLHSRAVSIFFTSVATEFFHLQAARLI